MRLEHGPDTALRITLARRSQGLLNLGWMMGVIVYHHDAARLPLQFKAPCYAPEAGQHPASILQVQPQLLGGDQHRSGVESVVLTGQSQPGRKPLCAALENP